jgi:hypothetical protein
VASKTQVILSGLRLKGVYTPGMFCVSIAMIGDAGEECA